VKHARKAPADRPPASPPPSRLGGIRAIGHDEDERPSREDRSYGETMFNRATVPLPRFLTGRRKPRGG
jgi:hypothetical protein